MALTINNTTYSGEHAGVYIGAALNAAKSMDYLTVIENIRDTTFYPRDVDRLTP